ncbi:MAG: Hsp70 family protein [Acidobacteria bacterium]|nr:Hsp70 family protein [Acidobacteriota bacterium]
MKDYWRLIGLTSKDTSDDQIRQAHFRTFRFYQGRKNESKNPAQRAVAELVIDYLRNAQHNPDLPLPSSLKHLLPTEVQAPVPAAKNVSQLTSSTSLPSQPSKVSIPISPAPPIVKNNLGFSEAPKTAIPIAKAVPPEEIIPPTEKISLDLINQATSNNQADEYIPKTDDLNDPKNSKIANPGAYVTTPIAFVKISPSRDWGNLQSLVNQVLTPAELLLNPEVEKPSTQAPKPEPNIENNKTLISDEVNKTQSPNVSSTFSRPAKETKSEIDLHKSTTPLDDEEDISLDLDFDNQESSKPSQNSSQNSLLEANNANQTILSELSSSGRHVVIGDVINCPDCEWDILSQTDSYCSGCGKSITSIAVAKELIVYISDTSSYTKSFTITNDGLIPIKINAFEVIDIDATIEPTRTVILGKNESLQVNLRVSENNPFGKRSGRLRFRYHDKPLEIPIQIKEPPQIQLTFPDVPNARNLSDGFFLRLPISQPNFTCQIETNSETLLKINSITLGQQQLITEEVTIKNNQPFILKILAEKSKEVVLTIGFQELGSRKFLLKMQQVEVPNLVDQIEQYSIGEQAIILGSGIFQTNLLLKNSFDSLTNQGNGIAEKIYFKGAPSWLKIIPDTISRLNPNENCVITLEIDSNQISLPSREYIELELHYFDPQLICHRKRPQAIQLTFEFIEPKEYDDWIAIDFGTSNSCAAMMSGTSIRSLIIDADKFNPNPSESPTCIQFVDESQANYECGMSAYTKRFTGQRAIKATAWAFKPLLSRSYEPIQQTYLDIIHGRAHTKTVDQLIAIYAKSLLEAVKLRNGITPRKAVVTFPVTFGKSQRERLIAAFKTVGLDEVIAPVSEPVALAIHYAYLHREIFAQTGIFAVFDFGGGTTDLAIFQIEPSSANNKHLFHLLDVSGVDLGGELLTFELARFIYQQLVPSSDRNQFNFPNCLEDLLNTSSDIARENYRHLAAFAEYIKRSFQKDETIFDQEIDQNLTSSSGNQTFRTQLSRKDIETVLRPHIEKLIKILIDMISSLYERKLIKARKLDWILLGGNSSRLPLVTEMLAEAFFDANKEKVLLDTENIKLGVTKGALLYAIAPEALPFPVDQVNHTLPCRVGLLTSGYRFDPIFERGITNTDNQAVQERYLILPVGKTHLRLYYYFGHEADPKVLDNPKMKEFSVACSQFSGQEMRAIFKLLPECAGIEVILQAQGQETKQVAPILGMG